MASAGQWVQGARPRTLPAAVSPVLAGTGAAAALGGAHLPLALLALVVALALQVGVNYANDYSDGVRGTDRDRVGPLRLVGSGVAEPAAVRRAALAALGVAGVAGLLLVGAASIAAAWTYTGGRRPYGYLGLGEVFVFVFFGLVAVLGTTYVQAGRVDLVTVLAAVGVGLHACAILVANNLRDVPTDAAAGKRTLAVRLGAGRTRRLFAVLVLAPPLLSALTAPLLGSAWPLVALAALALALPLARTVAGGAAGRALVPVLAGTGRLELVHAALLALGLALTR